MTGRDEFKGRFALNISEAEIELRKKWLEFSARDEEIIRDQIDKVVDGKVDGLIEAMYGHFLSFDETASFFPDQATLNRAQSAQKQYFIRLTKGKYDKEYVDDRLRVGSIHHHIDLDTKWYIGAYNRVFSWFLPRLSQQFAGQQEIFGQAISALLKLIFFDMGLAIECYIAAKEAALRQHRDVIRELETVRRVTKSILEGAPIGIVSLSEQLVCLECNDVFVDIIDGADRTSVVGRSLFEAVPGLSPDLFQEVLSSGHAYRQTADLLRLTKSSSSDDTYWDWAMWPVKDDTGKVSGIVAMFANATDRVLLQRQREDFVATLTHDLKTPVSATNRAVRFLLDGDFGPVADSQRELLETILQSNTALYGLVQTLLDVYRFDSGVKELNMRLCNLAAAITQLVTQIMPLAQEKGVDLNARLPTDASDVRCDDEEIRRVLQNLIDNSLKFTPSGGSITISMSQDRQATTITVVDTGKGIPEENKPKLFQRFWQAGTTGRYYASTGLGLYLCRRIVEAHGGRIWFESTAGHGSSFNFDIPT